MRERVLHIFAFTGASRVRKIDQTFIKSRIWKDFLNYLRIKTQKMGTQP